MSKHSQMKSQDVKNINGENFFEDMSHESCELFLRALFNAKDLEICDFEEETEELEIPPPDKRHKMRMNRLFRERVGGSFLPFPEADNLYERLRSRLVIKLKFFDRRKKRGREIK